MQTAVASKTTADSLARQYRREGYKVKITKVPKGTPYYKAGKRYYIFISR